METVALIIGIVCIFIDLLVYISNRRSVILMMKLLSSCVWSVNNFLLGAITGGVLMIVAAVRSLIFNFREKYKWADSILWLFVFVIITLVSPILSWQGPISLLPAVGSVFAVVSFYVKPVYIIWGAGFISQVPWLTYHILMGNLMGAIGSGITLISVVIGVVREIIKKRKQKESIVK